MRSGIAAAMIGLAMLVLLGAGVLKLVDPAAFARSLATWRLIPDAMIAFLALTIPSLEIAAAGSWLLGIGRARAQHGAVILFVLFTAFYGAHIALGERPVCGCIGRIAAFDDAKDEAIFVVGRNLVLLGCLVGGTWLGRARQRNSSGAGARRRAHGEDPVSFDSRSSERGGPQNERPGEPRACGFTLIEVIVVIVMIAILLSLLLPALRQAKFSAEDAVSVSNLRSHAAVFTMYTLDWSDTYPWFTDPEATYTVFRADGIAFELEYFDAHAFWNLALAPDYYDGHFRHPSFTAPGANPGYVMEYWYSASFLAVPAFWRYETRTGPDQWRPVGAHQVDFPSKKGLLFASYPWRLGPTGQSRPADLDPDEPWDPRGHGRPVHGAGAGFVDGSARWVADRDFLPGYRLGEGDWPGSFFLGWMPTMHTIGGARGRDVP